MAALGWAALTLGLFLSVGNSRAIDAWQLARIMDNVLWEYWPNNRLIPSMFSLAVSIPKVENKNQYDVSRVVQADPPAGVMQYFKKCRVYTGSRVVAATVLKWPQLPASCMEEPMPWADVLRRCRQKSMKWSEFKQKCPLEANRPRADHAEYRTLKSFRTWNISGLGEDDLMVVYVSSSPCYTRCTNSGDRNRNILGFVEGMKEWKNYAFVFSHIFIPNMASGGTDYGAQVRTSLTQLGKRIGLQNIFRCVRQRDGYQICYNCAILNGVNPQCTWVG